MLYDIVYSILGELPQELQFIYAFGIIAILYCGVKLFKAIIDIIVDFARSLIW